MKRFVYGMGVIVLASLSAQHACAADGFPERGMYEMTVQTSKGVTRSKIRLEAASRETFENAFAGRQRGACRERRITITQGAFSFSQICDAPDGDIHNLGLKSEGTFSSKAVNIVSQMTLWGQPIAERRTYRFLHP
ncbi:hypothetical protein LWE61_11035 [Sphingobium sufflavum]|uniref:hypothetical protein n=1 Tax=Sphingobium sufflavum TaxID=1129547 RepID=UPI001F24888F|nr:hypothetical protein [Sphingobium sufflavum]MCE7797092.1 hypothetical protein [Sphingobium sufflavum]